MLSTAVRTLKAHEGAVHVVRYNSNGGYFLSGGQDRKIILQNPNTGAQIKTYEAHGKLCTTCCSQKVGRCWTLQSLQIMPSLPALVVTELCAFQAGYKLTG